MAEVLSVRAGTGAPLPLLIAQPCRPARKDVGRRGQVGRTSRHGRAERGRGIFYDTDRSSRESGLGGPGPGL